MRMAIGVSLSALMAVAVWAQQPAGQRQNQAPPPLQGGQVTAADLAAIVAKQPKDRNGFQTFLQHAPYNVNMEHRVNMPQAAAIHETDAELFYVVSGGGTMVTGGKLVEGKRTNADNWTGSAIEGGASHKLAKGDFLLVPEGTPHWFSAIDGELTLMSLHLPKAAAK